MNLDSVIDEVLGTISTTPSIHGSYSLPMPTSKNISLLRTMFSDDLSISLTPVLAAVCLGIPSLIYCFHATGTMLPEFRVRTHLSDIIIARNDEKVILTQFVNEVIFGKKVNREVRLFDLFSSVDEVGKLRWP
jgi:hypothetical protein